MEIDSFYSNIKTTDIPNDLIEITSLLKQRRKKIRGSLVKVVNDEFSNGEEEKDQDELKEIIHYANLSGETYYRSFLVEILGIALGVKTGPRRFIAMLLEMINTQMVMQNNLPYMDNKDFRHKNISCHKKYGLNKTAIAISSINSLVFHLLSSNEEVDISKEDRCKIIEVFAKYNGKDGESGRQMMKIGLKKDKVFKDVSVRIRKMKIMPLFSAGAECLQILAKTDAKKNKFIKSYINNLCDILEMTERCMYCNEELEDEILIAKAENFLKQANGCVKFFTEDGQLLKDFVKLLVFNLKQILDNRNINVNKDGYLDDNSLKYQKQTNGLIEDKIS